MTSAVTRAAPNWRQRACVVVGVALVLDAVFLMADRLFNFGVMLPLMLGLGLLMLGLAWPAVQRWLADKPGWLLAWRWLWIAGALWLSSLMLFWILLARAQVDAPASASAPAAIVVLGAGTPAGKVSPLLAARLDKALQEANRYPNALVMVSGGIDLGESLSEGRVMGDYLRAHGLSPRRIVQEEKSTSTEENLVFCRPLLEQHGIATAAPIHLVTSDFHTVRASWIASHAGYTDITPVGSDTPLYLRYNAWLREYFAFISGFVLREWI